MSEALLHHRTVYVGEADLEPSRPRCPVCHSNAERKVACRVQVAPVVDYLECPDCRACSVSRMPTTDYLKTYYANYYSGSDEQVTFQGARRFSRHIARLLSLPQPAGELTILDFGGGDGRLSRALAAFWLQNGLATRVRITVVDFVAVPAAESAGIVMAHQRSLDAVDGTFDLVLASAVVEHIPDMNSVLRRLFGHVRSGGFFYARTPYVMPFKKRFPGFEVYFPMHLHDLGKAFWNNMLTALGLSGTIVASRPSIVSTELRSAPVKTALAYLLKLPARIEGCMRDRGSDRLRWPYVGGWEIVLRKTEGR